MSVTLMWLNVEFRRRARSVLLLAVLVALSAATVLTAFAGARRADSANERLDRDTLPATVMALPNTPGFDWEVVRKLPEVEALTKFVVDYSIEVTDPRGGELSFPLADDEAMRTIERPVVLQGRVFDPTRVDEVVVSKRFVERHHRTVGDGVDIRLPTAEQMTSISQPQQMDGPRVHARIVGVVISPWFADEVGGEGAIIPSPALVARYPAETLGDQTRTDNYSYVNALVRLRGGEAGIPEFRKDLARVTGRGDIEVTNLPAEHRENQRTIHFEALCLVAFGLAALAAACFLVGQSISRHTAASVEELRPGQALGMTRREIVYAAIVAPSIAGAAGALLSILLLWLVSDHFPLGAASLLEPSPGRDLDWLVVGPGAIAAFLLVGLTAVLSARRTLLARNNRHPRRSTISDALSRGSWPVPVVIGARFALEPGRGRRSVPVRPAIAGAVIGLLGVTSASTFGAAVHEAEGNPERFGQTYDAGAFAGLSGADFGDVDRLVATLGDRPEVDGLLRTRTAVVGDPSGDASVSIFTYDRGEKPLRVVMTSGRLPHDASEIALTPVSLRNLHASVGDHVELVGSRGRSRYLVTGIGFVPTGPHNSYADGAWVTSAGYDQIVDGFKFDLVLLRLNSGSAIPAVSKAVAADPDLAGFEITPPDPLLAVAVIRDVTVLPVALGVFLVLLALGAVGHALATAVRRRSGDLAVLRAIGFTPWQCRSVIVTQSTLLAALGLVIGVPLGVVAGRLLWRAVADYMPLQYAAPLAGIELILTIPTALLAANLLGIWPGHRAARLQVHRILRAA